MANLKMTISLPEELAVRFVRSVPANRRSQYIADLLGSQFQREREHMLNEACKAANADLDMQQAERDMASLPDTIDEEWHGTFTLPSSR